MRTKTAPRMNIMLRIAALLLVLFLVSLHLVSGLFARYTSTADGSDGARVAKFQITESLISNDTLSTTTVATSVVPGVPCEVKIDVSNSSEVAVTYEITVAKVSTCLDLKFYVITDAGGVVDLESIVASAQTSPYVFSDSIAPNAAKTYSMYVVWTPKDDATALELMGNVDMITLDLSATQID